MNESYDPSRYAGSRFKNSRKGICPHCGDPISHGLFGNPYQRKIQPCQRPKTTAQAAVALPTKYSLARRRGKIARSRRTAPDANQNSKHRNSGA